MYYINIKYNIFILFSIIFNKIYLYDCLFFLYNYSVFVFLSKNIFSPSYITLIVSYKNIIICNYILNYQHEK